MSRRSSFAVLLLLLAAFCSGILYGRPITAQADEIAEPFTYSMKRMLCAPSEIVIQGFLNQGYAVVGAALEYEIENDDTSPIKLEVAVLVHPKHRQVFVFETRGEVTCLASKGEKFLFHPELLNVKRSTPL